MYIEISDDVAAYNHIDENGMVVSSKPHGSKGDAVGRTCRTFLLYRGSKHRQQMIDAVKSCFKWNIHGKYFQLYRYPVEGKGEDWHSTTSRDHYIHAISSLKQIGEDKFVKNVLENRGKRVSEKFRFTLDNEIWFKALYSKTWSYIFAIYMTPYLLAMEGLNRFTRLIGGYGKHVGNPNRWQRFLNNTLMKVFPTFASSFTVSQVNALASIPCRNWLRCILLTHFESTNWYQRLMCGEKIKLWGKVYSDCRYKTTRAFRWTTRWDESNNRDTKVYYEECITENVELGALIGAILYNYEEHEIPAWFRHYIEYNINEYHK